MRDHEPAELARLARRDPAALGERLAALSTREQAELTLRLPPEARVKVLLNAPRPMRLVRSIPDFDLYLTVREVGPIDALPVIKLASADQLNHLFDMESWRGDRFDARRSGAWLALLAEAGEAPLRRFLRNIDDELLAMLFVGWIRLDQLEFDDTAEKHGHGLSETGEERGYVTPDGGYRYSPVIPEHAAAIRRTLQVLFIDQPERYNRILWTTRSELPSEIEEQARHWRQSRLEEHGFAGPDEASAIYEPPRGLEVHRTVVPGPTDPDGLSSSRAPLALLGNDPLARAIARLDDDERDRVLAETVALIHRVLVADDLDTGAPESHRCAGAKAAGFVRIAFDARGATDTGTMAGLLRDVPVVELFREGWSRVGDLGRAAHTMRREGWAAAHPRALELLDSPVRERVAALLLTRPLYVPVADGVVGTPREFASTTEVEESRIALEMAVAIGRLFVDLLGLDVARAAVADDATPQGPPRFSSQLLTLLAWHATRGELRGDALPGDVVADFLRTVASRRTAAPDAPERALERLVRVVAERFDIESRELALVQAFGRSCLEMLAAECGNLDPGVPIDPRYVACLLLA